MKRKAAMYLYHATSRDNRASILANGLIRPVIEESRSAHYRGGIFFSTMPSDDSRETIDVWSVNVAGVKLERDTTTEHDDSDPWMVAWFQDIEPWRLQLLGVEAPSKRARILSFLAAFFDCGKARRRCKQKCGRFVKQGKYFCSFFCQQRYNPETARQGRGPENLMPELRRSLAAIRDDGDQRRR